METRFSILLSLLLFLASSF